MKRLFFGWVIFILVATGCGAQSTAPSKALSRKAGREKQVLAFYYGWYGNPKTSQRWLHWEDVTGDAIGNATDYPVLGAYDSHDPKVIDQQCLWAKQAGITGFIVSWWGAHEFSDETLQRLLAAAARHDLKVTAYVETTGGANPTAATALEEVLYLLNRYGSDPAWLRFQGRPVLFVYGRAVEEIGLPGWNTVREGVEKRLPGGAVFIGDRVSVPAASVFNGLHEYDYAYKLAGKTPEQIRAEVKNDFAWEMDIESRLPIRCLTVVPGYDDHKQKDRKPLVIERRDGELYRVLWEEALAAAPDWILITSWNEWHEGSEIEPSREHDERELRTTATYSRQFLSN